MKDHGPSACISTALVTLLAIAGFCCIVSAPAVEYRHDPHHAEVRVDAERDAAQSIGNLQ